MNKVFILISFFLITTTSKAQENKTYKFTLEQAINFALDSNYTAINARRDIAKAITSASISGCSDPKVSTPNW